MRIARYTLFILLLLILSIGGIAKPRINRVIWDVPKTFRGKIVRYQGNGFPKKLIALTFDDGPTVGTTPKVLDLLKRYHAKATFYLIGLEEADHAKLVNRIIAEGHSVGIHTYSHARHPSAVRASAELTRCEQLLKHQIGHGTLLFRPPYGITQNCYTREAERRGYAVTLWTNCGNDSVSKNAGFVYRSVMRGPLKGAIVLLHDSREKQHTLRVLPAILRNLKAKGYRFVTVPELLSEWQRWQLAKKSHHSLANLPSRRRINHT